MKKFLLAATALMSVMLLSCKKESTVEAVASEDVQSQLAQTKATMTTASPIVSVYVETNDVNPLNALAYTYNGAPFISIVNLFAANIHVDGNGDPCLYLNDKLTNVLENGGVDTYVVPLQQAGIKVVLTVLGDWQNMGVCTMTTNQAQKFAEILAYVVDTYGLDGIDFDDEYVGTSYSTVSGSYGTLITKLHALLPSDKIITAFEYGHLSQISSTAGALLDYSYTDFGFDTSSSISGMTNDRYAPFSINLGSTYSSNYLTYVQYYANYARSNNYAGVMCFNLRSYCQVNPLPVFNAIACGYYGSSAAVTYDGNGCLARDAVIEPDGFTITYDDIQQF